MEQRVRQLNHAAVRAKGLYVLYWCRSNRRAEANHALEFAAGLANRLARPLLYLESLTCDYPYASERLHAFALQGMPETAASLRRRGIGCVFHVPRRKLQRDGAIAAAIRDAAAVVTDECPLPAPEFDVAAYAVDASCVVGRRASPRCA